MGWLRKQKSVCLWAASPTLWGAEEIVCEIGSYDLRGDWCEIGRCSQYNFKMAKSSA